MKNKMITLLTLILALSPQALATGRIQNEDVKSYSDIKAAVLTTTGNLTSGSACIASPASTTGLVTGLFIYDVTTPANISAGTTVNALPGSCSAGQIKMSANAAGNGTGDTITFGGQKSQLINDTKIYVTANSFNTTLDQVLTNDIPLNPMTTLGDTTYGGVSGVFTRLPGNTTAVTQYYTQTGTGSASAAPAWTTMAVPNPATKTSTGSTTAYAFYKAAGATATAGATYTNNGQTFTVVTSIAGQDYLLCTGTGAPTSTGTLTKSTGTGDSTIVYTVMQTAATYTPTAGTIYVEAEISGGGGGGSAGDTIALGNNGNSGGFTGIWTGSSGYLIGTGGQGGVLSGNAGAGGSIVNVSLNGISNPYLAVIGGTGSSGGLSTLSTVYEQGAPGGSNPLGGAGGGGAPNTAGQNAVANSGAGGGGGGTVAAALSIYGGTGGSAGGYTRFFITIASTSTIYYTIGGGGAGGVGGGANGENGGNGGSGLLGLLERFQ